MFRHPFVAEVLGHVVADAIGQEHNASFTRPESSSLTAAAMAEPELPPQSRPSSAIMRRAIIYDLCPRT